MKWFWTWSRCSSAYWNHYSLSTATKKFFGWRIHEIVASQSIQRTSYFHWLKRVQYLKSKVLGLPILNEATNGTNNLIGIQLEQLDQGNTTFLLSSTTYYAFWSKVLEDFKYPGIASCKGKHCSIGNCETSRKNEIWKCIVNGEIPTPKKLVQLLHYSMSWLIQLWQCFANDINRYTMIVFRSDNQNGHTLTIVKGSPSIRLLQLVIRLKFAQ